MQNFLVWISIAIVAALYSAVGHGGATGYLAILSLLSVPPHVMASTALTLNCLTAGISCFAYARAGYLSWRLTIPFVVASVPAAFMGAMVKLTESQYNYLLGAVLILTAIKLAISRDMKKQTESADEEGKPSLAGRFVAIPALPKSLLVGFVLGFLSGSVGIGGGVFLSPVIILFNWADTKTTSATAAFFIIANSVSGLTGRAIGGTLTYGEIIPYLIFGCIGAIVGSTWGVRFSTGTTLRRVLAFVLLIAAIKMFIH